MKYGNDPGSGTHVFFITAESDQGFRSTGKKQVIKKFLVFVYEIIEFIWDSKYNVIVSDPFDQLRLTFHDPFFLKRLLAAGAVTVITGSIMDLFIAALFTVADGMSEKSCLTLTDTVSSLALLSGDVMVLCIIIPELLKDLTDRIIGGYTGRWIKDHKGW